MKSLINKITQTTPLKRYIQLSLLSPCTSRSGIFFKFITVNIDGNHDVSR